jgi:hypothetical protein
MFELHSTSTRAISPRVRSRNLRYYKIGYALGIAATVVVAGIYSIKAALADRLIYAQSNISGRSSRNRTRSAYTLNTRPTRFVRA